MAGTSGNAGVRLRPVASNEYAGAVFRPPATTQPAASTATTGGSPTLSSQRSWGASRLGHSRTRSSQCSGTENANTDYQSTPMHSALRIEQHADRQRRTAHLQSGRNSGAAAPARHNRLSAPRSPAAPPIPPVPSSFTPAKGHRQSSHNGDVSDPTTAEQRGDLHGHGDCPAGRATPSATLGATSCSWATGVTGHAARTAPWARARWRSSERAVGAEGTVSQ